MKNEEVLNDVMRKTFPKVIFIRSVSEWNKTQAIHFSEEWLNQEYSTELAENKGEWIYDKGIENWRCSKCGQTPPPTGYVGKTDFMEKHFKFCPNCGADMRLE